MFYQDWGTYDYRTVVSINNKTYKELLESFEGKGKDKVDKEWLVAIKDRIKMWDTEQLQKNPHFTKWTSDDDEDTYYSILFLPEWKWSEHDYTILAHELIHAVSFLLGRNMDLITENEAMAYQHTFLMRAILQRLEKHKKTAILH